MPRVPNCASGPKGVIAASDLLVENEVTIALHPGRIDEIARLDEVTSQQLISRLRQ